MMLILVSRVFLYINMKNGEKKIFFCIFSTQKIGSKLKNWPFSKVCSSGCVPPTTNIKVDPVRYGSPLDAEHKKCAFKYIFTHFIKV